MQRRNRVASLLPQRRSASLHRIVSVTLDAVMDKSDESSVLKPQSCELLINNGHLLECMGAAYVSFEFYKLSLISLQKANYQLLRISFCLYMFSVISVVLISN